MSTTSSIHYSSFFTSSAVIVHFFPSFTTSPCIIIVAIDSSQSILDGSDIMKLFLLLIYSFTLTANSKTFGKYHPTAFASTTPKQIQAGDKLPYVDVHWGFNPVRFVNMPEYCGGRNVIIVGLPGAFTPT